MTLLELHDALFLLKKLLFHSKANVHVAQCTMLQPTTTVRI